ncbi:serine protease, partial [Bifidobacteriaceae bacterium VN002]
HLELKAVIHAKDLAEGNHILRVEATDYAGNSAAGDNQRTSIPFVKKKHAEPVKPDHSKPDVPGHNVNPNVPKKQEIPAPPDVNTPVPAAPKSVVELTKALKSNLLVGKYENNVARAGVENPMKLRLRQNSDIIEQLKKNKVVYAYAYIYSLPVLLHGKDGASYVKVVLDDKGQPHFDAEIPEGYSGKHTIVLIDNRGLQIAWTNVWVIPANATSFDETIAEYNLIHSESHSGFTFASSDEDYESASNIADNNEVNGSETNSGAYAGANGNANSNVNGNSKNANNNANSSLSNSLSSSKNTNTEGMLSKLGVTGAGIVFTLATLALLLLSGTFALFVRKMRM